MNPASNTDNVSHLSTVRPALAGTPPPLPPEPPYSRSSARAGRAVIGRTDNLVHRAVALILVCVAAFTLFDTTRTLVLAMTTSSFATAAMATAATNAVGGVLFAVIVVEIRRTVLTHFDGKPLQLRPFLIIGIVSAVREVLMIGARLSLNNMTASGVHTALLALAVNAAVAFALAASLVLISRYSSTAGDEDEPVVGGTDDETR